MHRLPLIVAFKALALCLPLAALQPQARKPPPIGAAPRPDPAAEKLIGQMQGLWRLEEFVAPKQPADRRFEIGYCMITGTYMTLELHLGWIDEDQRVEKRNFQSGMFRFEVGVGGVLECSTVIGSFIDLLGHLQFEEPNTQRRYNVSFVSDRMTLKRGDGMTFTFVRLPDDRELYQKPGPLPGTDGGAKPTGEAKPKPDIKSKGDTPP